MKIYIFFIPSFLSIRKIAKKSARRCKAIAVQNHIKKFHVSIFLKEEFHHVNCRNCTLERMKNNNNVFGVKMLQFFAQLQSNSLSTTFQLFVQAYKNTIYSLYTNHIVSLTRDFGTRVCMSTTTTFNTLQNIVQFYTNEKSLFRFWIEIFVSKVVTKENEHGNVQRPLICTFANENSRKVLLFSFQVCVNFSYRFFR